MHNLIPNGGECRDIVQSEGKAMGTVASILMYGIGIQSRCRPLITTAGTEERRTEWCWRPSSCRGERNNSRSLLFYNALSPLGLGRDNVKARDENASDERILIRMTNMCNDLLIPHAIALYSG